MPQLTIQIVGWNSANVLEPGLQALQAIPAGEIVIHYLDNNSQDTSVQLVQQYLPHARITVFPENKGFAAAHNLGLAQVTTPYVLLHDPDVVINWPSLKHLLNCFTREPKLGAIQGLLQRRTRQTDQPIIDSAGITLTAALNGRERGANETPTATYEAPARLLAVTGACGLYRLNALKQVAYSADEIFDNDFFAYKEDVDVGWRLNLAGWIVRYEPVPMGTHARTLGRRGFLNWGLHVPTIYGRLKSPRTRYSIRNWVWMIIKNASLLEEVRSAPAIAARAAVWLALGCLYPPLWLVWVEVMQGLPRMLHKRELALRQNALVSRGETH